MADIGAFVNRVKFIRDQTSAILNELGDDIEEYRAALEDMNEGLTDAINNFQPQEDPTDPSNPSGGARRRNKRKVRKSRKTKKTRKTIKTRR